MGGRRPPGSRARQVSGQPLSVGAERYTPHIARKVFGSPVLDMDEIVLRTERLTLRRFDIGDAPFIFELVNQRSFLEYIGDKGVGSLEDAEGYLEAGALTSYREHGFGPYMVLETATGTPTGMCGLYQRDNLQLPDMGYAFLERYFKRGYGVEASRGVMQFAAGVLGLRELAAIVDPDNVRSIGLLDRLGFEFRTMYLMPGEETFVRFYHCRLAAASGSDTAS